MISHIQINGLEMGVRIGVSKTERAEPQRVVCNISLWPEKTTELEDEIENTVNYSAVAEWVKDFAARTQFRLIETFADSIAKGLLNDFSVRKAVVEVRKFVLSDVDFVSVTASQRASEG